MRWTRAKSLLCIAAAALLAVLALHLLRTSVPDVIWVRLGDDWMDLEARTAPDSDPLSDMRCTGNTLRFVTLRPRASLADDVLAWIGRGREDAYGYRATHEVRVVGGREWRRFCRPVAESDD